MIESLKIENFRSFERVELDNLGRINIVVGDMASGKTAFLEALYMVAGNTPENHMKLGGWRGLRGERITISQDDIVSGELWRDMFTDFDLERRITISVEGSTDRLLVIARDGRTSGGVFTEGSVLKSPVTFTWHPEHGKSRKCVPAFYVDEKRLDFPSAPVGIAGAMLVSRVPASDLASRYSDLDKENRAGLVNDVIREEFPGIESLSVQVDATAGQLLYASLRSMNRKIPLAYVSSGVNRMVYILASVAAYPGGVIFVDEVENGIYFKRLRSVWSAINRISLNTNTQLFLSTHSDEAIDALLPIVEGHEEDFRLIRVRRGEDGRSSLTMVSGKNLRSAIESDVDVR